MSIQDVAENDLFSIKTFPFFALRYPLHRHLASAGTGKKSENNAENRYQ